MDLRSCFTKYIFPVALATAGLAGNTFAQTGNSSIIDAQTEANVLRSLAGTPELAAEAISTQTIAGTVTLSGSVHTEAQRGRAEQLASTTPGVQRVVDELTLRNLQYAGTSSQTPLAESNTAQGVLQSDGSYATDGVGVPRDVDQSPSSLQQQQNEAPPPNGPDTDPYGRPLNSQRPEAAPSSQDGVYPDATQGGTRPAYGQPPPGYGSYSPPAQQYGQPGGQVVSVPSGTLLRVRVNQHLSSRDVNVGTPFDAMVESDIVADGQVAIPRGAFVQGVVVDAENSGHLKGRGELGLRLTQVTLGGRVYPIASDTFSAHGGDKTIQTVNSAVGLGALGAIFGAIAGGGAGAAIGAGVGGAAGIGASAASGRGDVFIPSEAVLSFRLTQPASVATVSQAEMQRLAYGAPQGRPQGGPVVVRRRFPYPYYGPVYYGPGYYRPYGYYRY